MTGNDDSDLTLVKVHVTYPSPHDPERSETSWFQFYDRAPEYIDTMDLIESQRTIEGVRINIWYLDPEAKPPTALNHGGVGKLH